MTHPTEVTGEARTRKCYCHVNLPGDTCDACTISALEREHQQLREKVERLELALRDLLGQVEIFCETQGEADFETRLAHEALKPTNPGESL